MWQSPTPISYRGRELSDLEAWVFVFANTWQELEHDPEDLRMAGFNVFGPAVAAKHGDEDPAAVARRLYPEAGEYNDDLYPAHAGDDADPLETARAEEPAPPPEFGLPSSDVPF
ncbi:hypothetical protein [Variovorax sp. UMC13]|uniref:hypothetical protein n=1 Tax=Variovorax sp. UMC13 TaxID=1862326 RepID=UPI0015FF0DB0|nr:hypothetical protein [Variovorax sp. UMC13]